MADNFNSGRSDGDNFRYVVAEDDMSEAIAEAYSLAFGFERDHSKRYVEGVGLTNFRCLEVDGCTAAVMALIQCGHWLGGKSVPALNVAHVAIAPEWRGRGLAGRFLELAFAEAAERSVGLITLFASTRPVYRRMGFALAGTEAVYEAECAALPHRRDARFERIQGPQVREHLESIYRRACAEDAGLLDRSHAHWAGLFAGETAAYVSGRDQPASYVLLDTSDPTCLVLRDWAALDGAAAANLLSFVGTFSSVFPRVRWHGSTEDALVFAFPDKGWRLIHQEEWLAKLGDVPRVLEARGYCCDDTQVGINLATSAGDIALELAVRDNAATCRPRNSEMPTVEIKQDDFGTLVTGHRSASFLNRNGILRGDARAVMLCDAIFRGPPPWVGEHF